VPEGAGGDSGHAGGARPQRRQEAIECLGRQGEELVGIDLHAAVGRRRRLVRKLTLEIERVAAVVEGKRPHGRRAHVQGYEDRLGRRRHGRHAFMLTGAPAA
jgi:hypothetical protein